MPSSSSSAVAAPPVAAESAEAKKSMSEGEFEAFLQKFDALLSAGAARDIRVWNCERRECAVVAC